MLPEIRPRGIGEILDTAVAIYRERFKTLILVTIAVVIPVEILAVLVQLSAQPDSYEPGITGPTPVYDDGDLALALGALVVIFILATLATTFVTAAATKIGADAYVGGQDEPGQATRRALRRLPALFGLTIVVAICTAVGLFLCFLPGVLLMGLWSVAVPALLLEGIGVGAALGRSWNLAKQKVWHAIGVVLVAQLLTTALTFGIAALLTWFLVQNDSTTAEVLVQGVANTVSSIITTPLLATAVVALYFDLRIRAEGFDMQMMLTRLDARRSGVADAV